MPPDRPDGGNDDVGADDPTTRLGAVEADFRPSPGQTFAGTLVCGGAAAALFAAAAFATGLDATNRVSAALLGLAATVLAVWLFRLRRWRLVVCADGLVQERPGGVDVVRWADARAVVWTRMNAPDGRTLRLTVEGRGRPVVVNPVNTRARLRVFETLLAAAGRRGVPVRVEVEETSD